MGLHEIAAQIDHDNYIAVQEDTWGHLAPVKGKTYRGHMIQVGNGQVKLRRSSDKKGKDQFWVHTTYLKVV